MHKIHTLQRILYAAMLILPTSQVFEYINSNRAQLVTEKSHTL